VLNKNIFKLYIIFLLLELVLYIYIYILIVWQCISLPFSRLLFVFLSLMNFLRKENTSMVAIFFQNNIYYIQIDYLYKVDPYSRCCTIL